MKTKEILIEARKLIAQPEHWTQYEMARDVDGNPVEWDTQEAFSFCSFGAIDRVSRVRDCLGCDMTYQQLNLWVKENTDGDMFTDFNDNRSHAEVLAAFDEVIQTCE